MIFWFLFESQTKAGRGRSISRIGIGISFGVLTTQPEMSTSRSRSGNKGIEIGVLGFFWGGLWGFHFPAGGPCYPMIDEAVFWPRSPFWPISCAAFTVVSWPKKKKKKRRVEMEMEKEIEKLERCRWLIWICAVDRSPSPPKWISWRPWPRERGTFWSNGGGRTHSLVLRPLGEITKLVH